MGKWTDHLTQDGQSIDAEKAQADLVADQANARAAQLQDENDALRKALEEAQVPVDPPPPPPPDPKTQMWVGSSLYNPGGETMLQGYDRRCKAWGVDDLEMTRFFFPQMPTGWPQFGTANTVVSFKPSGYDVKGFGEGKYDSQTTNWLNSLPRDKKVRRVAIFHEREDDIEDHKFTFAEAKAMDRKMRTLIDEANARNGTKITFGIVFMGWTLQESSGRKIENYLPTDFKYDWIGWDAYPGNSASLDLPDFRYTKELFGKCKNATLAHNPKANYYICETGSSNKGLDPVVYDGKQAQWIEGATKIALDLGFKGFMYWDSVVGTGPANDYQVKAPKAAAAMGVAIKA